MQNCLVSSVRPSPSPSSTLIGDFNRLGIGAGFCESNASVDEVPSVSPTSVIEPKQFARHNGERVSMPKSISVRSRGYLKSVSSQRPGRQQVTTASLGQSWQMENILLISGMDQSFFHLSSLHWRQLVVPWIMRQGHWSKKHIQHLIS